MATSREQVIMRLATDLKVWPKAKGEEQPFFQGWKWFDDTPGVLVIYPTDDQLSINKLDWEAEIKRLSTPTPSVKWKEGDETTLGKIEYISERKATVAIRTGSGLVEYMYEDLKPKSKTKAEFIVAALEDHLVTGDEWKKAYISIIKEALKEWDSQY